MFYLYSPDLAALLAQLRANGVDAGEISDGNPAPRQQMKLTDPDGYVLMVAQIEPGRVGKRTALPVLRAQADPGTRPTWLRPPVECRVRREVLLGIAPGERFVTATNLSPTPTSSFRLIRSKRRFQIDNIRIAFVFYESGLSINVMYTVDDPTSGRLGFKLSEGIEVPAELASRFKFATGSQT